MTDPEPETFEFGLIMAGAISAGAYTAGVMDFLIEALDCWEAAKAAGENVPRHKVQLKVMTGASAGAITSAIAAAALFCDGTPVHDVDAPPPPARNRFHDAWVSRIDMRHLLTDRDLDGTAPVRSLLDASVLDEIAASALNMTPRAARRPWVADPLAVFLTVTNLRGVPYAFTMYGSTGVSDYGMTAHADHMAFAVGADGFPGARRLDPSALSEVGAPPAGWDGLAQAALASSAFPVGLRSRALGRPFSDYSHRALGLPSVADPPQDYGFGALDGGTIDNEPLELARRHLARESGARNPREGTDAHRAVIMIDPFPNTAVLAPDTSADAALLSDVAALFAALVNQARFKPEELRLAMNSAVYSRFLIRPSRRDQAGRQAEPAMASAILGGFGGFLSEQFRRHDFQLGRRNCQRFLAKYFALPEGNRRIFGRPDPAMVEAWCIRSDRDGTPWTYDQDASQRLLPIIPLVGTARAEVPLHDPPNPDTVDLLALENLIRQRIRPVANRLFDTHGDAVIGGALMRRAVRAFVDWRLRPRLARQARDLIAAELDRLR